jgi:hypothetical protein
MYCLPFFALSIRRDARRAIQGEILVFPYRQAQQGV